MKIDENGRHCDYTKLIILLIKILIVLLADILRS